MCLINNHQSADLANTIENLAVSDIVGDKGIACFKVGVIKRKGTRVQNVQNPLNRLIIITIGQEQSLDRISRIGETIKVRRMNSYGERFS